MADSVPLSPASEQDRRLHGRLLNGDPTAPSDVAVAFLDSLIDWLRETNPRLPPDTHVQAAEDAILALIHNPRSYAPEERDLEEYLRMSAQGDLRNILKREQRHHRHRIPWASVELSEDAGKYLGREDDPSLPIQLAEQSRELADTVPEAVRRTLSEKERRVLELILVRERRTAVYAEACGILHLTPQEQRREVKRLKDRLKKRMERSRRTDECKP